MAQGEFSGEPSTLWLTEEGAQDRRMKLIEPFWFRDPDGKQWDAPAGSVIDGASIPRELWTIVGSPYTGDYRRASIVHDLACADADGDEDKRRAADRMFFQACRAGGCSIWQSTVLYVGVRIGAAVPEVTAWQAAAAYDSAGPRIRRSGAELQLEHDFTAVAERVLAAGETDDAVEVEKRTDRAMSELAGVKQTARPAGSKRARRRTRRPKRGRDR